MDVGLRRHRRRVARDRQPRRARAAEREADARVLVDLARRLPADRPLRRQRARRPRAHVLPHRLRGDGVRLVRRASPRASASSACRSRSTTSPASAGSGRSSALAMWFFLFGFAGLPVGGGFVAKFYVLSAAYDHGWAWLVIVGVLATLVSLWLLPRGRARDVHAAERGAAGRAGRRAARRRASRCCTSPSGCALVVSVGSLFAVGPLIDYAKHAARRCRSDAAALDRLPRPLGGGRRLGRRRHRRRPRLHRPARPARRPRHAGPRARHDLLARPQHEGGRGEARVVVAARRAAARQPRRRRDRRRRRRRAARRHPRIRDCAGAARSSTGCRRSAPSSSATCCSARARSRARPSSRCASARSAGSGSKSHEDLRASLRPLLELPVEQVLVSHGEPVLTAGRRVLGELL